MLAVVLESKGVVALRDFGIEEQLGPNDVRIAISHVGICGSDVHYFQHGNIGDFVVKEPMILGHEASGTVTEVGTLVKHLQVGDTVCMEPGIPEFNSTETLEGMYNLDPSVRFWATPPIHGCLRESVVHPASLTFKLPANVSPEEGALVEPVSIGVYSAKIAEIEPADTALVIGAGTIGLVTALGALVSGCSQVIVSDIKEEKLDLVRKFYGNKLVCINSAKENLLEAVQKVAPRGVDILFEASGAPDVLKDFTRYVCPGGKAVLIGMPIGPVLFDVVGAQAKEISIKTIFRYRNMYPRTLNLIASGALDVKPLITHRYTIKDAVEAFKFASSAPPDAIKVMVSL
ncbi:MAG: NAD(P)-dependent alcohol dehydrogenase [Sphaerochaeta sp.]|nr:NAD(P)-dependent alcohol dehydrogenase [Sphaerochaeta sp.]